MKKLLIIGLVLLILAPALFADDAKVMPAKVGRFYVAPIYSFVPGTYDDDGRRYDFPDGPIKLFNLGFAVEYGINDWITAAMQWVPGVTLWSDLEDATGIKEANMNGLADLFAGVKMQIIGANAPVQSEKVRFAVAPGVIIPLPGVDFEEEFKNMSEEKAATVANMDNHVFAAGGRFYFDYVFNNNFFINFHNETIFYLNNRELNKQSPDLAGFKAKVGEGIPDLAAGLGATGYTGADLAESLAALDGEVNYRSNITFEIEPVFTTSLKDGIVLNAGIPINYQFSPASKYEMNGSFRNDLNDAKKHVDNLIAQGAPLEQLAGGLAGIEEGYDNTFSDLDSHTLRIGPNLSVFFMKLPLPLEFKFQYNVPVWGRNTNAQHGAIFQIRAYFKFKNKDVQEE